MSQVKTFKVKGRYGTGEIWIDDNGNGWMKSRYSKYQAEALSDGLINCKRCLNCESCIDCIDCVGCQSCKECVNCWGCASCEHQTNGSHLICVI